jgi:hypothetical protein
MGLNRMDDGLAEVVVRIVVAGTVLVDLGREEADMAGSTFEDLVFGGVRTSFFEGEFVRKVD